MAIKYAPETGGAPVPVLGITYAPADGSPVKTIKRVTRDGVQIWPSWAFFDDFQRTTIGTAWTGSGALIESGYLKKNNTNGSADYWTAQTFTGDDRTVRVVLGPIQDSQQRASILLGSSASYVFVEFSKSGGVIGDYDGYAWNNRADVPSMALLTGDVLELTRVGTSLVLKRNDVTVVTASSSQGRGTAHRRVALSVRRNSNVFGTYYGPTFDSVGVR